MHDESLRKLKKAADEVKQWSKILDMLDENEKKLKELEEKMYPGGKTAV